MQASRQGGGTTCGDARDSGTRGSGPTARSTAVCGRAPIWPTPSHSALIPVAATTTAEPAGTHFFDGTGEDEGGESEISVGLRYEGGWSQGAMHGWGTLSLGDFHVRSVWRGGRNGQVDMSCFPDLAEGEVHTFHYKGGSYTGARFRLAPACQPCARMHAHTHALCPTAAAPAAQAPGETGGLTARAAWCVAARGRPEPATR